MASEPPIGRAVFIVGAQKSATTSLFAALARHERVRSCTPKEPHFFSLPQETVESQMADYLGLFSEGGDVLLDGSTSYLHSERALRQIAEYVAEPTIVVILRDPAKRAYSACLHQHVKIPPGDLREFPETVESLAGVEPESIREREDALLREAIARGLVNTRYSFDESYLASRKLVLKGSGDDPLWHFRYLTNSMYRSAVEPYEERFGGRVYVTFHEDFVLDTERTMKSLLAFLDLPVEPACLSAPAENTTRPPSSLARVLRTIRRRIPVPGSLMNAIARLPLGDRAVDAVQARRFTDTPRLSEDLYTATRDLLRGEYEYWFSRFPHLTARWTFRQ